MDTILTELEREASRGLLKYAVGQALFCPIGSCGTVLDCRSAVLIEAAGHPPCVICGDCHAKIADKLPGGTKVTNGADLWVEHAGPNLERRSVTAKERQGRCRRCNVRFTWPASTGPLRGSTCPDCGRPLRRTTYDAWCPTRALETRPC